MRCSVNRLLQLATKPRLQSMRSDTSSQVWPSASSKISRARRASSARSVRLWARRVSSISSEFDSVMASLMDAIIVYKWLLQSTRNVKRWREGDQPLRWTATGLLKAEKKFRRIKGYQEILLLKERLNPSRIPQKEIRTVEVA